MPTWSIYIGKKLQQTCDHSEWNKSTRNTIWISAYTRKSANNHEEADVIIPQQVTHAIESGKTCVKVISDDTDVFILLKYFYQTEKLTATVLMESTGATKNLICIESSVKMHDKIVPYLPAARALTGCDSVPSMFNIGKVKVISFLTEMELKYVGRKDANMDGVIQEGKSFVACCYGIKYNIQMSDIRWLSEVIKCIISFYPFNIEPKKMLCWVIMINSPKTSLLVILSGDDENFDAIQLHTVYNMHTLLYDLVSSCQNILFIFPS